MELKAELRKPYTEKQRIDFIVENNHRQGYEIQETKTALESWGLSDEEKQEQQAQAEAERIAMLHLTRGDVFRALLLAKGVTRTQLRAKIEAMPEDTQEEALAKEMALIDFDEALDFYRGVVLIDTIGAQLGITPDMMTKFFETGDYHELIAIEPEGVTDDDTLSQGEVATESEVEYGNE